MPTRNGHRLRSAAAAALGALATTPAVAQPINEYLKLIASDGSSSDFFGYFAAVSGTTAIIGAYRDDDNGPNTGSAYLYFFSNPNRIIEIKLTASDGAERDEFGFSVGISGTIAIVGAYRDDDNGVDSGSAYLFDFSNRHKIIETKLTPSDGSPGHGFGEAVAVSGTTAIVGVPGIVGGLTSAYLYDFSDPNNIIETKLNASGGNSFGTAVAISGNPAIVGAPAARVNGISTGSAYLFDFSDPDNIIETRLTASDGAVTDRFGESVAISDTIAIVGAYRDDDNGVDSGSAYLFDFSDPDNIIETKLTASDGESNDGFGLSVGIADTIAIVGAYRDDDNGVDSGSAYLFDFSDPDNIIETKLTASDSERDDEFGQSVAISGTVALVGAYADDDNGSSSGSAYVFDFTPPCAADLNGDGTLDFFDVSAFLTAFNDQDPAADFNADTLFDFFDVAAFIVAFGRGCP
jgi:hypothetical protein